MQQPANLPFAKPYEPLVSMRYCSKKITIYPAYYLQKLPGSSSDLLLRRGVAERLMAVAERLPGRQCLVLFDGWRSLKTQRYLYDRAVRHFREQGYDEYRMKEVMGGFVAYPSGNPAYPPPHYTGAAVDLTLGTSSGWLNMGTAFDDFTPRAHTNYFERRQPVSDDEILARNNRRFLRTMMETAGFTQNPDEWWHFSYGDRTWAEAHRCPPLYGGINPRSDQDSGAYKT